LFEYFLPFQNLNKIKFDEWYKRVYHKYCSKGEIIFQEGTLADKIAIIYQGECELYKNNDSNYIQMKLSKIDEKVKEETLKKEEKYKKRISLMKNQSSNKEKEREKEKENLKKEKEKEEGKEEGKVNDNSENEEESDNEYIKKLNKSTNISKLLTSFNHF